MSRRRTWRPGGEPREAGVALLFVLAALVLVLALSTALVLTSIVETRVAWSAREDALLTSAADAVAARVLVDLKTVDWGGVLGGAVSTFSDGPPGGTRHLPWGGTVDLDREAADLACGRMDACSDAAIRSASDERPWGDRNPRWRLYAFGPLAGMLPGDPAPPAVYVAAWVADDPADGDGDPLRDAADPDDPGHDVMLVTGRAWGPGGLQRTVQLAVQRTGTELRILTFHERGR